MRYKLPKTTGVMERHFLITKLNHSIMRLIIRTERQGNEADGQKTVQ